MLTLDGAGFVLSVQSEPQQQGSPLCQLASGAVSVAKRSRCVSNLQVGDSSGFLLSSLCVFVRGVSYSVRQFDSYAVYFSCFSPTYRMCFSSIHFSMQRSHASTSACATRFCRTTTPFSTKPHSTEAVSGCR